MAIALQPPSAITARRAETAVAVAMVAMMSAPLFPLLFAPTRLDAEEVVWMRWLWAPVYAATVFVAAWDVRDLRRALPAFAPTALLLFFAAASMAWSIAPDVTLRRVEALAFNSLLAFWLAARFGWRALVEIIAAAMVILALGSLAMCLAWPSFGVHQGVNAGAWRGLWPEKNELGFMMVIGAQACVARALLGGTYRAFWLGAAALCAGLVVMSRSGTSVLCLIGALLLALGLAAGRRDPILAIGVAFVGGCLALALGFVVVLDPAMILDLMGKDPTLTGRTEVWTAVAHRIAERPVLGYGYAAFWHDLFGPALLVRREAGWAVPSAHNGWLEVLLQLGWAGAILAGGYFAITIAAALRRLLVRPDGFWAIMYVSAFAVLSASESQIEKQNSLAWVLFAATSIKLVAERVAPSRPAVRAPAARR